MHKVLLPFVSAAMVLFALPAFAETYTGVVAGFDTEASILIVDEEMEFMVPDEVELPDLQNGDVVTVEYDDVDDTKMVTSVTVQQ